MSMLIYLICSLLLVIMSVWCFVSQRKHLLMILLSLGMIVLSMFFMLFLSLSEFYTEISFRLLFLTLCVCEGSLGLSSVFVSIVRSHGNDCLDLEYLIVLQC